jgi:DNA-binding PadR family transcriptional regulator
MRTLTGPCAAGPGPPTPALCVLYFRRLASATAWSVRSNGHRSYYRLSRAGERQLAAETAHWQRISLAIASALQAT